MRKKCKPLFWILSLTVLVLVSPNAYAQVADIAVTPTSLAFGTVNVGATATLTTTISNVGGADLTVSELAFTGSPDFSLNPAAPLAPFVVAVRGIRCAGLGTVFTGELPAFFLGDVRFEFEEVDVNKHLALFTFLVRSRRLLFGGCDSSQS